MEKPVDPKQLYDLIELADRLIVRDTPSPTSTILFESSDKRDLAALQESLEIKKPDMGFRCACSGSPAIWFNDGDEELLLLTNHHAQSVRCSLWSSDAPIVDIDKWLTWFDERDITGPRAEFDGMEAQRAKNRISRDRWAAAVPAAIKPLMVDAEGNLRQVEGASLEHVLEGQIPDQSQRILVLLEWFGTGEGPWSGFPSYESTVEGLLLGYKTADIVTTIESATLTQRQSEGAARLFAGWEFRTKRPEGSREIPDSIIEMLWDHAKSTGDEDKLERATRAFRA